jgi:hypothetical protein
LGGDVSLTSNNGREFGWWWEWKIQKPLENVEGKVEMYDMVRLERVVGKYLQENWSEVEVAKTEGPNWRMTRVA